mgnify:CR=1 FL=1
MRSSQPSLYSLLHTRDCKCMQVLPHCKGVLRALLEEHLRDVFAVLPTGLGKSLLFILPALMRRGLTLVVMPLVSLMSSTLAAINRSQVRTE